jgi:calcineurin-like phosphoesterase family protein
MMLIDSKEVVRKEKGTMRWFTSDTHFGHTNILKFEPEARPFSDTNHMDEVMIENWNAVVAPGDEVWHLGDAVMGDFDKGIQKMQRLNGKKILIPGNHDRIFSGAKKGYAEKWESAYREVFDHIQPEITAITMQGINFLVSHFPYAGDHGDVDRYPDKRPYNDGRPLIHGHVHSLFHTKDNMFNVGVDVNDLTPVAEQVLVDWARTL